MVCYHLDRFSSFVASDGFFVLYDISAEEKKKILSDDAELMLFGFRFLKQILRRKRHHAGKRCAD